jgi:hypothetical protein
LAIDRGRGKLALSDDKKKRGTKGSPQRDGGSGAADRDIGHALRSVYSKTVGEDIPPELLDLLGKLK